MVGVPGRGLAGVTGVYPPPTIHLYAYYFDRWVDVQAGYYDNSWVKLLIHCGRPQWVWLYEQYPNGTVTYRPLGYVTSGYYFYWTQVQGVGWHLMALWGSADGWSNLLYVYVWPRAPPPPPPSAFTVRVWSDKTSYRSGEGINIYVYVNQPAVVHLTVEGPGVLKRVIKWLHEPGTHLFITGVAGPPGWRTVTAKAWTRAGDYAECEYKYYVSP